MLSIYERNCAFHTVTGNLGCSGVLGTAADAYKRAVNQVVAIFEHNNALDVRSARTIDELGLRPPTFLQSMIRMRDFKPYALQVLMKAEVVLQTDGGKLYLSQDRLAGTNVGKR